MSDLPSIDVVIRAGDGWRTTLTGLGRQTVAPHRVLVEGTAPDAAAETPEVMFVAPGTAMRAIEADYVCFLEPGDDPVPGWLSAVAEAAATGADAVRWGVVRMRPDGIVAGVDIPPVRGTVGRNPLLGIAIRRTAAAPDGSPRRRGRALGVPKLLVMRRGAVPPVAARRDRPAGVTPSVSVIMPVHNAAETLAEQLTALAAQDYTGSWELVVVDNGSTDRSAAIVAEMRSEFAACRTISATATPSAGYARNAGSRAARGELLLFCDADDVADPGWVRAMAAAAAGADLVGGALDCAVLSPTLLDEQPSPMPDQPDFLPFARSANCGIWRAVLDDIGGWPEHFRGGGGEDVDLSWRAQLAGYRLAYAADASMGYRLRPTLSGLARQKWRYGLTGAPLFRDFRHAGYQRRPARKVVWSWWWLARHLPDVIRAGRGRRRWVRIAARLAGFAAGSLRHRVAYL